MDLDFQFADTLGRGRYLVLPEPVCDSLDPPGVVAMDAVSGSRIDPIRAWPPRDPAGLRALRDGRNERRRPCKWHHRHKRSLWAIKKL